jgi:hypothetical protein
MDRTVCIISIFLTADAWNLTTTTQMKYASHYGGAYA